MVARDKKDRQPECGQRRKGIRGNPSLIDKISGNAQRIRLQLRNDSQNLLQKSRAARSDMNISDLDKVQIALQPIIHEV